MQAVYPASEALRTPFRILVVEPIGKFSPTNWRQTPTVYRVLSASEYPLKGSADADRFLFNQTCLKNDISAERWAIVG